MINFLISHIYRKGNSYADKLEILELLIVFQFVGLPPSFV